MVETMAYAGEVPWHGLGVRVPADLSTDQMLQKAGLDWSVEKRVMSFTGSDGSSIEVPNKSALVRSTDDKVLDVVGMDWNPVQNQEAFDFFAEYVNAGDMEMHTAGSLRGGQLVWALAKTKDSFELFKGDQTDNYLLFSNPHQYGKCIDIKMTPIRVVCNNTLTYALGFKHNNDWVRLSHRHQFDQEAIKSQMGIAREKLEEYRQLAQFIGTKRYTSESIIRYFNEVFTGNPGDQYEIKPESRTVKNALEIMHTQPGAKFAEGTYWQAFNTVTYMTDHVLGRTDDGRLDSAWFGRYNKVKTNALNTAVEYAEAA